MAPLNSHTVAFTFLGSKDGARATGVIKCPAQERYAAQHTLIQDFLQGPATLAAFVKLTDALRRAHAPLGMLLIQTQHNAEVFHYTPTDSFLNAYEGHVGDEAVLKFAKGHCGAPEPFITILPGTLAPQLSAQQQSDASLDLPDTPNWGGATLAANVHTPGDLSATTDLGAFLSEPTEGDISGMLDMVWGTTEGAFGFHSEPGDELLVDALFPIH